MKVATGLTEKGILVGNLYDKYSSRSPLIRYFVEGFTSVLWKFVERVQPQSIHEVGCGEGYFTLFFLTRGIPARGSDFSEKVIAIARANAAECGFPPDVFQVRNIYDLHPEHDAAELVVCLEVLEHLEEPGRAMHSLRSVAQPYCVLSVPHEPLWSILNVLRGRYLRRLGNTPGHIHRWSKRGFLRFVEQFFDVQEVATPVPWTMVLCRR